MQYDNLPKELRDNGKFCLWNYEERKGKVKPDKVPYQINGKRAQSGILVCRVDYRLWHGEALLAEQNVSLE